MCVTGWCSILYLYSSCKYSLYTCHGPYIQLSFLYKSSSCTYCMPVPCMVRICFLYHLVYMYGWPFPGHSLGIFRVFFLWTLFFSFLLFSLLVVSSGVVGFLTLVLGFGAWAFVVLTSVASLFACRWRLSAALKSGGAVWRASWEALPIAWFTCHGRTLSDGGIPCGRGLASLWFTWYQSEAGWDLPSSAVALVECSCVLRGLLVLSMYV